MLRKPHQPRYVGIMICERGGALPFPERDYFRKLCLLGHSLGMTVYIFSPEWVRFENNRTVGYTYNGKITAWEKSVFPLPNVLYDRCYYANKMRYDLHAPLISKLRKLKGIRFMGYGLKGKWDVQQALHNHENMLPHLPYTELYQTSRGLSSFLNTHGEAFLKPHAGSHGKGVMHLIKKAESTFELKGRNPQNSPFHITFRNEQTMLQWVRRFMGTRRYLIQEYLKLTTTEGEPYDIRSLVQKDGGGNWRTTGMAVRKGKQGSITSNLAGGGHAEEVIPFLSNQFDQEQADTILTVLNHLSSTIPEALEQQHGRLAELGIDLGVDTQGRVWILEVNSKPGRSVFTQLNDLNARKNSVKYPIQYARYLLDRQLGG
ncbi:hypothetical protein SY83_21655 [Paenibacillus swuensis]|uniref:ATP-grasp domain-containing protein n=1 Tax=Paenibacillus swuensis TaxID=1178515 RepID=A0A172TN18_9BACL|nr:YheC/YheD family protein [Paenibacillus swuensis]ANE48455.1 hypothetical protein SY83_21655 [Paenibacillus swuensis]